MKVFADLHHFDLYHSFQLLFEKRLGWELCRPIGLEWYREGFWKICDESPVIQGYLSPEEGKCLEGLLPFWESRSPSWARFATELVRVGNIWEVSPGLYSVIDNSKGISQTGITLEYFKSNRFDIIISSVPQHFPIFERLRQLYQPWAKHIFHMGPGSVEWEIPTGAKNVLLHSCSFKIPKEINHVFYSQEFDLDKFYYSFPTHPTVVRSYVHYPEGKELWDKIGLPWDFKFIGKTLASLGETIVKTSELSQVMRDSGFTWHYKPGGESYGHILHNTYAVGRPAIIDVGVFKNKRGGRLLEDMVTCIDIKGCSPKDIREKLEWASQPENHLTMCINAKDRFDLKVNFDQEEVDLRLFMENLQ